MVSSTLIGNCLVYQDEEIFTIASVIGASSRVHDLSS